ncbi:MAG TPA: pitrilysin family protein [Thermoanaerobaculia bacterium]|nr:pitrilysin family protein [Thermoanaerobaculia bacterium]
MKLDVDIPCETRTLPNGLTVVVAPQPGLPVVTVAVTYDVGSRVEPEGKTGFAHLFEHLMFEGSENVPKGEHFRLVADAGGTMNGTTSEDRTNYFETLPAECLDLALFLEADRMRALVLTEEKLANQREAVKEEKRLRVDNQPYAPSFETADALAYDAFAYRHPVIGSMDDLDRATLEDARDFYGRYYAPGNALLCLAGDVEAGDAFARAASAFGPVPPRGPPLPFSVDEPAPRDERRAAVRDPHAALPALHVNAKGPARRESDALALLYAEKILGGGESGTLWRRLVKDEEKALSLSIQFDERRGPSLFRVFAVARPGVPHAVLEAGIREGLSRLADAGPTPAEMERARRQLAADMVRSTQTTQAVAFLLSEYGLYDADAGLWREDFERILSVDAAGVRDAAARTFDRPRISVVEVHPGETA